MVMLFVMIMMISPFVYEGGSIVFGQWQSMYGTHWEAKTPVLDATRELYRNLNRDLSRRTSHTFLAGNWDPSLAVPLAPQSARWRKPSCSGR